MIDSFFPHPDFSLWLCLTLVHSLWIWAVIAVFVFVLDRLMKRTRVENRYRSHLGALLIGLASLPLTFYYVKIHSTPINSAVVQITAPRSTPLPTVSPALKPGDHTFTPARPASGIPSNEPAQRFTPLPEQQTGLFISQWDWQRCLPWLAGGYLLGVVLMLMRLLRSMLAVNRLSSRAIQLTEGPLVKIVSALASQWSLKLKPRIAQTEELIVPTVVGLFRPLILLPTSMLSGLTTAELELILTHELAHVRRWDMWVNLLQRLAETILFFNPGLWYVSRKISVLREFCCDEMTCSDQSQDQRSQRIHYASALLRVLELTQPQQPQTADLSSLAVSGASPSEVRRRVARLFGEPLPEPFRLSRSLIYVTLLLSVMLGSAIWASQSPSEETHRSQSENKTVEAESSGSFQLQGNVEVVALGTYNTPEQRWWNLSGEQLNSVPYQQQPRMIADNPGETGRQIIYRIRNLPAGSSVRGALIRQDPATGKQRVSIMGSSPFQKDQRPFPPGIFGNVFSVKEKQNRANVRISVASGAWDTRINLPADNTFGDKGLTEGTGSGTYHIQMSGPYQQQDKIVLVATHDNRDREVRIIALDKEGQEHRASQSANTSISQNSYFTYRAYFKNLKLEDLDHFEFQTRPYESIEIDDVPLNPEKKAPVTTRKPRTKKATERVEVSGKILLEDGSPAQTQGQLCHQSPGILGTVGIFTDSFQGRFPTGELVLTYFPENYAPVRLDVGTLKAGVPHNDLKLILKPGHTHQLNIQNEQGQPVPEATVVIHPNWGEGGSGPIIPLQANAQGALTLQHLTDTPYDVNVSAPGYEPRQLKQIPVKADGTSTITLKASQKTTGRILDEAGQPVAGVTLYLKRQFGGQRPNTFTRSGRGNFWGTPLTKTDQDGRYELTEMTTDAEYLFVFEAPDGRRAIVQNLQAGGDQEFVLPDRRDLRITFSQEFLQQYSIKNASRVAIRQHVMCEPAGQNRFGELIGADVPIKVTAAGGTAFFPGLAINTQSQAQPQEVSVGLQYHKGPKQVVKINPNGETRVNFTLANAETETEQTTAPKPAPPAGEKISVVVAKHLMLLNGRQPITWEELDRHFAQLKHPAEVRPAFYITRGALGAKRAALNLNQQIGKLQQKYHFRGSSQGTLPVRTDYYYDHLKTNADLQPDPAHKRTGQVVDFKGKPVAHAEVLLITPVPESVGYKTYGLALVQGHIRNPVAHIMTRSNSQGEFTLYPPAGEQYYIMALHPEQGIILVSNDQFASHQEIKLLPWSGLMLNVADVPGEIQTVSLRTQVDARESLPEISINQYWSDLPAEAQKQRFVYPQVPPLYNTLIQRMFQNRDGSSNGLAGVSVNLLTEEVREISLGPLSPQQTKLLEGIRTRFRVKN